MNIADQNGSQVIFDLMNGYTYCPSINFIIILVDLGMNPSVYRKADDTDIIDVFKGKKEHFSFNPTKSEKIRKLIQIINQWEAKRLTNLKLECLEELSLLMTKKIIEYSIHRKADLEEVWNLMG